MHIIHILIVFIFLNNIYNYYLCAYFACRENMYELFKLTNSVKRNGNRNVFIISFRRSLFWNNYK